MLKWLHSLAAAISGATARPDRLDAVTGMAMDEDSRDSGHLIEPRAPASNVDALEELERLLREPSRGP
jgi:hypothetical protein